MSLLPDLYAPFEERPDIGVLITQLDRGIFVTKQNIHPAPGRGLGRLRMGRMGKLWKIGGKARFKNRTMYPVVIKHGCGKIL